MEYFIELIQWLNDVKINLGMGLNLSLMSILKFPLYATFLKMLLTFVVNNNISFGRNNNMNIDVLDKNVNDISGQIQNKNYYIESAKIKGE